jgi:hypothetical protein
MFIERPDSMEVGTNYFGFLEFFFYNLYSSRVDETRYLFPFQVFVHSIPYQLFSKDHETGYVNIGRYS